MYDRDLVWYTHREFALDDLDRELGKRSNEVPVRTQRVERLLKLIHAVQSGRSYVAEELAKIVGASRRTVFRDLEILARAGIAYSYDRETRRYSADRALLLPPVTLTHCEALTLLLAIRFSVAGQMVPNRDVAFAVGLKVEGLLPAALSEECGSILRHIGFKPTPASDTAPIVDVLAALQDALTKRRKLRIGYDSYFDRAVIDVTVRPYHLSYIHRGWYVIGYSEEQKSVRTFKVERITGLMPLDETFDEARPFNLEEYLGNAWTMIRGDKRFHVKIRFGAKVAGNVEEIIWHKTQRTRYLDDGSMLFDVDVDGVDEILWWVLGYGAEAEVIEPVELRCLVAAHICRMQAMYTEECAKPSDGSRS